MEIPKNTFNSLRKRAWLAESKSTRNTLWAVDDDGFKKALSSTGLKYPLIHFAKWRMEIDRCHFRVTFTELLPSGLFGRIFHVSRLSRDGLYNFLSQFFIDEEVFPESMKLTLAERMAKFSYAESFS